MDRVKRTCELASNLNYERDHGVVVSTLGHPEPDLSWGLSTLLRDQKKPIVDGLREIGDIASEFNVIIGLEPHVGNLIDSPENGAWAITQANHNNIKLDFDISHFICQGIDVQHSFNLCAKYAGAVHIKDGYMENGKVVFQLPGEGALNLTEYLDKIVEFKLSHLPVFAEVSFQLYTKDNYDDIIKFLNLPYHDKGIDILAIGYNEKIYGIQAKFRSDEYSIIPWGELATFPGLCHSCKLDIGTVSYTHLTLPTNREV